jgi:hypothetical protein
MYVFKLHAVLREILCGIAKSITGYATICSAIRKQNISLE